MRGEIELKGVGFRYGARAVTRDVDLLIHPGEMIGLVGHSGSGKSTLVNLICRFYDVSEGAVFIDGVDVRSVPVAEFRSNIGLVLQEPFLFFGTIADNIAYGKPDATREIIAAARAAHAHEFILRLPHGYDSWSANGARACPAGTPAHFHRPGAAHQPQDSHPRRGHLVGRYRNRKEIQKALDNLVRGRTIAIAHRLSTTPEGPPPGGHDRSQVVEVGSHDELMAGRPLLPALPGPGPQCRHRTRTTSLPTPVRNTPQAPPRNCPAALRPSGSRHRRRSPKWCRYAPFPSPNRNGGISLVDGDGHERAWIDCLADLPAPHRQLVEEELASREFVPEIRALKKFPAATPSTWQVDTDHGPFALVLKGEEDIRRLSQTMLMIADSNGIQFLIRDLSRLDRGSRN